MIIMKDSSEEMELWMARGEVYLRVSAILVLVLTACLVAFDTQTKVILLNIEKKANFKDVNALKILVYITSAAASYNMLQLCKHFVSACSGGKFKGSYIYMAWISLLLDQIVVYITFAANSAAVEASVLAITGSETFQWMKICNRFTRFCFQIGGAVVCGYLASIIMALISTVSAYQVFRMYSQKWFLRLKGT